MAAKVVKPFTWWLTKIGKDGKTAIFLEAVEVKGTKENKTEESFSAFLCYNDSFNVAWLIMEANVNKFTEADVRELFSLALQEELLKEVA